MERAHIAGVSLGAAVAMHFAARHPERVRSLSLHSAWDRTDAYVRAILEMWRALAGAWPVIADVVIGGIFPLCFTPEMCVERPDYAQALADFGRGRPAQPPEAFLSQTALVTSTRFAQPLTAGIVNSELIVFGHLSHGGLHEDPEAFNRATLDFLLRQRE